jgi:hypothetical protein
MSCVCYASIVVLFDVVPIRQSLNFIQVSSAASHTALCIDNG